MTGEKQSAEARQRLEIMEETSDGFKIAEKDLEIRGPGEVMGTRQSGLPAFRIGNIVRDHELLELAKREADRLLKEVEGSNDVAILIETVRSDPRFGLAAVG
jgi:ATP-dependent DNA helicase RecG